MQQINAKRVSDKIRLSGDGELQGKMYKKLKFDHTNNPESILENKMHKILWDFDIQTDHLIPARWPDLVIVNNNDKKKKKEKKRTCRIADFAVLQITEWKYNKTKST